MREPTPREVTIDLRTDPTAEIVLITVDIPTQTLANMEKAFRKTVRNALLENE